LDLPQVSIRPPSEEPTRALILFSDSSKLHLEFPLRLQRFM